MGAETVVFTTIAQYQVHGYTYTKCFLDANYINESWDILRFSQITNIVAHNILKTRSYVDYFTQVQTIS